MVTASAANPVFFSDYLFVNEGKTKTLQGGGTIASNPSLYAFFQATEFLQIPPEKISMTTVGGVRRDVDKISANVNPVQWINRIIAITSPVK